MTESRHREPHVSGVFCAGAGHFGTSAATAPQVDVSGLKSLRGVLRRLGEALALPDWYGGNLDALFDCLCDESLDAGRHATLAIAGLATLRAHDAGGFTRLLEAFSAAAAERAAAGRPLAILLDIAAPGIPALPA